MPHHTTLRDLWQARVASCAQQEFLVVEDPDTGAVERYTYAEFDAEVARAANLLAGLGVGKGDRVAVQLCNRVEFVECFLALACIGAVLVPLGCALTEAECQYVIDQCGARVLITETEAAAQAEQAATPAKQAAPTAPATTAEQTAPVEQAAPAVDTAPAAAQRVLSVERYGQLKREQAAVLAARPVIEAGDLAEIMYTSGTTSRPKGVMITHANMVFSGRYVAWELGMGPADRYLTCMAVTHVNFQLSALVPAIHAGAALILQRRYSARTMWSRVRRHRATLVQAMAMIVRTLLRQPVSAGERDHCVREVHYFLPLSEGEKEEFERRFAVRLLNNYGSTESLVGSITDYPSGPRRWPSIGRPGPCYEVRIVACDGAQVPPGVCGQIQIRGEPGVSLMAGYWKDAAATAAAIDPEGWYSTGDAGYVDADGWVYFTDRLGEVIKRAGESISAAEIEHVLLEHPGVQEVAVLAVADEIRDEAVKAVIVPAPGAAPEPADIRAFASRRLACFKIPEIIEFRDRLPRGEYGKVQKNSLRQQKNSLRERHRNGNQDGDGGPDLRALRP